MDRGRSGSGAGDDGDVTGTDVLVIAVPATAVRRAFQVVRGYRGAVTIDATNLQGVPPAGHPSLAHLVQSYFSWYRPLGALWT